MNELHEVGLTSPSLCLWCQEPGTELTLNVLSLGEKATYCTDTVVQRLIRHTSFEEDGDKESNSWNAARQEQGEGPHRAIKELEEGV